MVNMSYFLISVSNKKNLLLCKKYSLAGFTDSINGAWTFSELQIGDFVSFLYAAKAHNLYQVEKKDAFENAEKLPPWKPVTFKISGKTYSFPFRLRLKPIRIFEEPLIRMEFAYVAENLLLRGGYRKTHFQADQTTLQNVSQMGIISEEKIESLELPNTKIFVPKFTLNDEDIKIPKIFPFREVILQALIRQYLSEVNNLKKFLDMISVDELNAENLEVLGEKALPEGHIDIFIKESVPIGLSRNIIIEVKTSKATKNDFGQLKMYLGETSNECLRGVLIAKDFGKKIVKKIPDRMIPIKYSLENFDKPKTFEELKQRLRLEEVI
jgi:hypothetical protein